MTRVYATRYLIVCMMLTACANGSTIEERARQDSLMKDVIVKTPQKARDLKRQSDVMIIMNGLKQYMLDNFGELPNSIPRNKLMTICTTQAPHCEGKADLDFLVSDYLVEIPTDPKNATEEDAGYTIYINTNGTVAIEAPHAEQDGSQIYATH